MRWTGTGARPAGLAAVVALLVVADTGGRAEAQAGCQRGDFEAVVDESASALRELNQTNKPAFQDKLRLLREKKKWTHDQFLTEAAPFVQDDRIADYDMRSNDLLAKITAMGQEGSVAKAPDCGVLAELHGHMKALVDVQSAKWSYMFGKIDDALTR
jgi:hypothetical protein